MFKRLYRFLARLFTHEPPLPCVKVEITLQSPLDPNYDPSRIARLVQAELEKAAERTRAKPS